MCQSLLAICVIVLIFQLYIFILSIHWLMIELWVLSPIMTFCFSYTRLHFAFRVLFSFILVMFFLLVYRVSTHRHCLLYFLPLYYSFDSLEPISKCHPCPSYFFHPFTWICIVLPLIYYYFHRFHFFFHSIIHVMEHLWSPWSWRLFICCIVYVRGMGILSLGLLSLVSFHFFSLLP